MRGLGKGSGIDRPEKHQRLTVGEIAGRVEEAVANVANRAALAVAGRVFEAMIPKDERDEK